MKNSAKVVPIKKEEVKNDIIPFDFEGNNFRSIKDQNDNPLFVGKDACNILGIQYYRDALSRLDNDEKTTCRLKLDGWNQARDITLINESGLYSLIMKSNKPIAKKFKRWITHEVLPSIRKYGTYINDIDMVMNTLFSNLTGDEKESVRKVMENQIKLQKQIKEDKPKVDFYKAIMGSHESVDIGKVAKVLAREFNFNIGRNRLFDFLKKHKVLMNKGNEPYQKYIDQKYFEMAQIDKEYKDGVITVYFQPRVFARGIEFIYKLLKKYNEPEDE